MTKRAEEGAPDRRAGEAAREAAHARSLRADRAAAESGREKTGALRRRRLARSGGPFRACSRVVRTRSGGKGAYARSPTAENRVEAEGKTPNC